MLAGAEASLVCGALEMMVDQLIAEGIDGQEQDRFAIDWFDQWDWRQRIWLLDEVASSLLTPRRAPEPAAMYEATVDAVFCEIYGLVSMELSQPDWDPLIPTWRQSVLDAFASQYSGPVQIDHEEPDLDCWRTVITQLSDGILGSRQYHRAEAYRDDEISERVLKLLL